MLAVLMLVCVGGVAAFLYMGGMRGKKLALSSGGAFLAASTVVGAVTPKPAPKPEPQLEACARGYARGTSGECSLTCEAFKFRAPKAGEERYHRYCEEAFARMVDQRIQNRQWPYR
ncbi:MAG: hypothetical protein AB7K64_09500 [Variibacter sp.]